MMWLASRRASLYLWGRFRATISAAVELAEDAIKLPEVIYFDALLDLDAVKTLQRTKHAPLYRLLEIFCREGPKELEEFNEKNPNVLETYGKLL